MARFPACLDFALLRGPSAIISFLMRASLSLLGAMWLWTGGLGVLSHAVCFAYLFGLTSSCIYDGVLVVTEIEDGDLAVVVAWV